MMHMRQNIQITARNQKQNPVIHKQVYENEVFFLLNVYKLFLLSVYQGLPCNSTKTICGYREKAGKCTY